MEETKVALIRGLKQGARIALAAAIASIGVNILVPGATVKTIAVAALVAAFEGASKYVASNPNIPLKGLYGF